MTMKHILIQQAKRKPYTDIPKMPEGAAFEREKGYWISSNNTPLVSSRSEYGALATKKCDQETGEDQKGE